MDGISKVFFIENELEKINFLFWKKEFGTHWESCAYHRIFVFGKALLARLYLMVKVYITKLVSVYIIY